MRINNLIKFSCIIPAYNEEGRVGNVVKIAKSYPLIEEVIVVSDGSIDKTVKEARLAGADKVIDLKKNLGKGGAVFVGAEIAKTDFVILLDADLINLSHQHLDLLTKPIINKVANMTIGVLVDDINQKIFPAISGQRVVKKKMILKNPQLKKSRFQLELLLNQYAKKKTYRVVFVNLRNLGHIKKRSKYNKWIAILKYLDSFFSFFIFYFKKSWLGLAVIIFSYLIFFPSKHTFSDLDILPLSSVNERILFIVAHPDDEIIGGGGYLAQAIKNGTQVKIVIVTNGEGNKYYAYMSELGIDYKKIFSKDKFINEAKIRMQESIDALTTIGLSLEDIIFLDFPDRSLDNLLNQNWNVAYFSPFTLKNKPIFKNNYNKNLTYKGQDLEEILRKIIIDFRPTKIFTHSSFDKHSDHRAVNQFVGLALQKNNFLPKEIYTFLIHYNNFSKPLKLSFEESLLPPKDFQNRHWLVFHLDEESLKIKEKAINKYQSQLKNPYLNIFLKSFLRKNELFHKGLD